jgi:hypothetical protein
MGEERDSRVKSIHKVIEMPALRVFIYYETFDYYIANHVAICLILQGKIV